MTLRNTIFVAAGASLLTIGLPALAQETQPMPPEVPSNPAPAEAPPPPAPPETPAPPSPPPAQSEGTIVPAPGKMSGAATAPTDPATAEQMPMNPAPGTMPGAQNTNITNPPPAPQAVYPPCTRTLQDQCTQSSAREADYKGGPPANRRRPRSR